MSLFPGGTRTQHTDIWKKTRWTTQLLYGHEARLVSPTRKKGVAIEAWRKRGSPESLAKVNHVLCEAESEAESGALVTEQSTPLQIQLSRGSSRH
jgi:hypothetical protein